MVKKAAQATPNNLLRAARKAQGWTQQQVADMIGAPLSLNVTRWERGTASPSAFYVQQLCRLFGRSARELGLFEMEESNLEVEAGGLSQGWRPYWNVPYRRNPFFTGREELLLLLEGGFGGSRLLAPAGRSQPGQSQPYALSGLGGIGKTQLAVEYAYQSRERYQAIFWVRAASRESLSADFSALAQLLALPEYESSEQRQVVEAVLRWLSDNQGWLLILDNADDLALVADFLPSRGQGHILLTTRAQATGKLATSVEVAKMGLEEGMLFLLHRSKLLAAHLPLAGVDAHLLEQARWLVQALDGLPLAIDQAAAYIEESGCGLEEYRQLYRGRSMELLILQSAVLPEYPYTVASTWALSFQQVEKASAAAAELLRLCAFLDADAIPEMMLSEGAAALGLISADALQRNEALRVLRQYSLVRRNAETKMLDIHRLVQVVIQAGMDEETRRLWAERAVRIVDAALIDVPLAANWPRYQQCLSHAQICAELIKRYDLAMPEAARLLDHSGCYLRDRGQYGQAEALLQQALLMREQLLGPEHSATIETLDHLGFLSMLQGHYAQAETLLRRVLHVREREASREPLAAVEVFHHLANVYYLQHNYEQAEPLYQRALRLQEEVLGHDHHAHADILNSLGLLYGAQGKYGLAEPLYLRAITLYERALGPNAPELPIMLNNLGGLYWVQGYYEEAEQLYLRALPLFERGLGADHPFAADALCTLGDIYSRRGQYDDAEALLQRSLAIKEQALGKEHPHVAVTLTCLGYCYFLQGYDERAEACYLRALAIQEQMANPEDGRTATTLYNLACLYGRCGRDERAEALMRRALLMRERVLGAEHPETSIIREEYDRLFASR